MPELKTKPKKRNNLLFLDVEELLKWFQEQNTTVKSQVAKAYETDEGTFVIQADEHGVVHVWKPQK